jgi:CO/xanthine dehydrogenase Mo-binding subunit
MTLALYAGTEFIKGKPKDTNLGSYRVLRIGGVPEIEIEFLPSKEVGLGEPATTAVAPAAGNAIFAATGARVRHVSRFSVCLCDWPVDRAHLEKLQGISSW